VLKGKMRQKNVFNAINKGIEIIEKYPTLELCVNILKYNSPFKNYNVLHTIQCTNGLFYATTSIYSYVLDKKTIKKHLLDFNNNVLSKIVSINLYGTIKQKYIDTIGYHYKNDYANIIQKAWKKYRIKTARIRNDLVIRGLSEYWYHPSRMSFEIKN